VTGSLRDPTLFLTLTQTSIPVSIKKQVKCYPLRGEKLNYKSVAKEILKPSFWGVPEVQ